MSQLLVKVADSFYLGATSIYGRHRIVSLMYTVKSNVYIHFVTSSFGYVSNNTLAQDYVSLSYNYKI